MCPVLLPVSVVAPTDSGCRPRRLSSSSATTRYLSVVGQSCTPHGLSSGSRSSASSSGSPLSPSAPNGLRRTITHGGRMVAVLPPTTASGTLPSDQKTSVYKVVACQSRSEPSLGRRNGRLLWPLWALLLGSVLCNCEFQSLIYAGESADTIN